ncbi:hypothetical protein L6452_32227 [Arctium lappa]|uniref:Uncharacterized protein n=1 Tax=Arctium lappa TaxID=4217 RepID=A0ACB8Z4D7_ARCLA|nr:hypothetical protein L6452_32227 [Arctium lappa]
MPIRRGDRWFKVSPWKGIIRFGKRGKLSPQDSVIPLSELMVDEGNRCVEEPDAILERKSKKLRHKEVTLVKIRNRKLFIRLKSPFFGFEFGRNLGWSSGEFRLNSSTGKSDVQLVLCVPFGKRKVDYAFPLGNTKWTMRSLWETQSGLCVPSGKRKVDFAFPVGNAKCGLRTLLFALKSSLRHRLASVVGALVRFPLAVGCQGLWRDEFWSLESFGDV